MSARRSAVEIPEHIPAGCVSLTEYRTGRNYIRIGDIVKCSPRVGASFLAPVRRIFGREGTDHVVEIEVIEGVGQSGLHRGLAHCVGSRHGVTVSRYFAIVKLGVFSFACKLFSDFFHFAIDRFRY